MSDEFIDTNIVIYSLSLNDSKQDIAINILASRPVLSIQVLSETANIMRRKLGFDIAAIRAVINRLTLTSAKVQPLTLETINSGFDIAERYGFSHYDSPIIAAAIQADCQTLYSEDMQHGQAIGNRLKIINPFL